MFNLKNNENDLMMKFAKIEVKIKIKFQKMKSTFLVSIPWLKSHQTLYIIEWEFQSLQVMIFLISCRSYNILF